MLLEKFKTRLASVLLNRLFYPLWVAKILSNRLFHPIMRGGDCKVLSSDPLIIYVYDWVIRNRPLALLPVLGQYNDKTIHVLVGLTWNHDDQTSIKRLIKWQIRYLRQYPRHKIVYMCNSANEYDAMVTTGLKAAFVSHNAFVSPAIFKPLQKSEKRFDAVYDARINPFKRHILAAGIKSLALITARSPFLHDKSYTRYIMDVLPQAYFFNNPLSHDYKWMSLLDINMAINQCRVGLCLSDEEGAMYASIQYLLAGLPVVSTKSRGGRDEFFSPEYVRIVSANPEAVADGVREMCNCPLTAEEIRCRTLDKIEEHKKRFFELLDSICSDDGWCAKMRLSWDSWAHSPRPLSIVRPFVIAQRIEDLTETIH